MHTMLEPNRFAVGSRPSLRPPGPSRRQCESIETPSYLSYSLTMGMPGLPSEILHALRKGARRLGGAPLEFSLLAFVSFDPRLHADLARDLAEAFVRLDHFTGKHLLFFAPTAPPGDWLKAAKGRPYWMAFQEYGRMLTPEAACRSHRLLALEVDLPPTDAFVAWGDPQLRSLEARVVRSISDVDHILVNELAREAWEIHQRPPPDRGPRPSRAPARPIGSGLLGLKSTSSIWLGLGISRRVL